ncbi:MAG: beta-lactamase family protein [Bryobacterales bacterium]|nr:beta-lactamase family protein [Bryobacterales bacterium]
MRRFLSILLSGIAIWAASPEEQRVDAVFERYAKADSPGCALGVLRAGETILAKGYGLADLEHRLPLTPRTRFYMASVSKQFTSMALLLAEADGKLRLDDGIRKWIPELPAYADAIPIRRMLDHTSGLRDYLALWSLRGFSNESVLKEGATLSLIARQQALNFPVGSDYNYSNSGYLLASIALRRATGKPLDAFVNTRIFQPLEMSASRFQSDHGEPVPDRAHGYHLRDSGWKTADVGFDLIGSGGMYSNIEDMLRWARNFEKPVIGAALLSALQTPGKLADGRRTPGGYALGIIEKDGTYSHSGGAVGYSTYFLRVPKSGLTVVCLCNVGGAPVARLAESVASIFTGQPLESKEPAGPRKPAAVAWKAGEMARLAGSYWSEELFSVWQFTERAGKLWLQTDGPELAVEPAGGGRYRAGDFEIQPKPAGLEVSVGRARGIRFSRR